MFCRNDFSGVVYEVRFYLYYVHKGVNQQVSTGYSTRAGLSWKVKVQLHTCICVYI